MIKLSFIKVIIVFLLLFINIFNGQKKDLYFFSQNELDINRVFPYTFELCVNTNTWFPSEKDTIPYLVDISDYKGFVNYGVKFNNTDKRVFEFTEDFSMFFLKIEFESCIYKNVDSIIEIEGTVRGGWGDFANKGWNKKGNYIDIFLGEIKDTISPLYFKNNYDINEIEVTHNGKRIENYTVLDTFPSFYLKKYVHQATNSKNIRRFKIKQKINEQSILVFGARGCYSEIYDIGSMVFLPNKNKMNKLKKQELIKKDIIIKNQLISDNQNSKIVEINYYKYTEEAENFILKKQYANAKNQYNDLNKKYPILFARDIHNAIRCSILSIDYEAAFFWAEKLAKKGVEINYFNSKIFKVLKMNKLWKSFSMKYDSIYNEYKNYKNYKLKENIEKLVEEDQADYGLANRKKSVVLFETTERVTNKLIAILNQDGYPSEEKIGVYTMNDSILIVQPDYHVLFKHAIQQMPKNFETLNRMLKKSEANLEYDHKRSNNNNFLHNACFHIYNGNLYNSKSCGSNNLMVRKIKFIFNNPYGFIINNNNSFIISEYNKENTGEKDKYYSEQFNFVMKLPDEWKLFDK